MAACIRLSALVLLATTACGFPRPPDVGDDAPGDASSPGVTVHVSPTGDDVNDGLTQPVKTLKRAISIVGTNPQITNVALGAGIYAAATGETFPYTVPANLTIVGPDTGGAVLAGTKAEAGLVIDSGRLQDLEFEDFTVAITATGAARLINVSIRTSMLALRGETTAKLTTDNLDITGSIGASFSACQKGIVLVGAADLAATAIATRNLVTTLYATDTSTIHIANANITEDPRCAGNVFEVSTTKTFTLGDSYIIGGSNGIAFTGTSSSPTQAMVKNTTMRGLSTALSGGAVMFEMIGGELFNNDRGALDAVGGIWSFTNVTIRQNGVFGIYLQGPNRQVPGVLTMRGCTVSGNSGDGVYLFDGAVADLGTTASPGNNTFQSNAGVGVDVFGVDGPKQIDAVGNTWNAMSQGSDTTGLYLTTMTISGPVAIVAGNNYAISNGLSLRR